MCELGQLQELGLAYNPLGPDTPRRLINMLATSPHLKRVAFDGGMITGDDPASLAELREKGTMLHQHILNTDFHFSSCASSCIFGLQ